MANSIDPDETAYYEPFHLDLHYLQKPVIFACGCERVQHVLPSLLFAHELTSEFLEVSTTRLATIIYNDPQWKDE